MFEAKADPARNLLTIHFSQHVEAEGAKRCLEEVARLLPGLGAGFRLLTDLSGLDSMEVQCAPHIRAVMDLCSKKQVAAIVRIIPDPHKDIGFNILSLFHYGRGVHIVTCETAEEAQQALG